MLKKVAQVGICALAVVILGACAGGGGDSVSDEELIQTMVQDALDALAAKDVDKMIAAYADDFQSDQGGGKEEIRTFMTMAKDQGLLEGLSYDLSSMVITVNGDAATAKPVDVEGNFGALTLEFEMEKRDGQWWVTYQSQY